MPTASSATIKAAASATTAKPVFRIRIPSPCSILPRDTESCGEAAGFLRNRERKVNGRLSISITLLCVVKLGADGALAQLGERRLCKPEVTGSIPVRSTEEP